MAHHFSVRNHRLHTIYSINCARLPHGFNSSTKMLRAFRRVMRVFVTSARCGHHVERWRWLYQRAFIDLKPFKKEPAVCARLANSLHFNVPSAVAQCDSSPNGRQSRHTLIIYRLVCVMRVCCVCAHTVDELRDIIGIIWCFRGALRRSLLINLQWNIPNEGVRWRGAVCGWSRAERPREERVVCMCWTLNN